MALTDTSIQDGVDQRYLVISTDSHVGPAEMTDLAEYMDQSARADFASYLELVERLRPGTGMERASTDDDARLRAQRDRAREIRQMRSDASGWLRDQDSDGVAAIIVLPDILPQAANPFDPLTLRVMGQSVDPALQVAGCRAYNRWLADFCATDANRLRGVAMIPVQDVPAAVAEVEHAHALGLTGGVWLPAMAADFPRYNDPCYEPLWAACASAHLPLHVHGGTSGEEREFYGHGPEEFALRLAEVNFIARRPLWFMIMSGVFERHQELTLVFTEQQAAWVPQALADLDSIYGYAPMSVLRNVLPEKPSHYFSKNCFIGASYMSRNEAQVRHEIGLDRLMWGSDYPHPGGTFPRTREALRNTFAGVPADEVTQILTVNPATCYRVELDSLRSIAARVGPTHTELGTPLPVLPNLDPVTLAFRDGEWS